MGGRVDTDHKSITDGALPSVPKHRNLRTKQRSSMEDDGIIYCDNDNCWTEAMYFFTRSDGKRFHLCQCCKDAFVSGQCNPTADIEACDGN